MPIHADAVAHTVGEVLVVGTIARVGDHLLCGGVYRLRFHSGSRLLERGALRAMDDVENLTHLVGGLAQDKRSADVRLVALH